MYFSASAFPQILYNSRDWYLHISTLLSLLSTLQFSVLGLRLTLHNSHSDPVFIIIIIDTVGSISLLSQSSHFFAYLTFGPSFHHYHLSLIRLTSPSSPSSHFFAYLGLSVAQPTLIHTFHKIGHVFTFQRTLLGTYFK